VLAGVARLVSFLFFGEKKNVVCYAHTTRSEVLRAHTQKKSASSLSLSLFREHARDDFTTVKPREKDPTTGVVFAVVKAPPFKQQQQQEEEEFDEKRRMMMMMMISFVNEKKDFDGLRKKKKGCRVRTVQKIEMWLSKKCLFYTYRVRSFWGVRYFICQLSTGIPRLYYPPRPISKA